MHIVTPYLPFPPISWWVQAAATETMIFDGTEHFQKMTLRNRYRIAGANNSIQLSIPLAGGRGQRTAMMDVKLANEACWQVQHWRTLVSVYRRTPFFYHYEPSLAPLYATPYTHLASFNAASIAWVKRQLKLNYKEGTAVEYIKMYPPPAIDMRGIGACTTAGTDVALPAYQQIFGDRIGFLPDLSILDLLFAEGPNAARLLSGKD